MSYQDRLERMASELTQITASLNHIKKSHIEIINRLKAIRLISIKARANELSEINDSICVIDEKI